MSGKKTAADSSKSTMNSAYPGQEQMAISGGA
jgi:hypothetical protein